VDKNQSLGTLALVSPNYEDVSFCVEVCQSSGLAFQRFDKIEQATESAATGGCSALFADVRDEEAYQRIHKALTKALQSPQCILSPEAIYFLTSLTIEQAPYLINGPSVFNYVMRNYKDPKEAGNLYGRLLKAVLVGDSLNLSDLLGENAKIKMFKPSRSTEKEAAIEEVLTFLKGVNFHPRIASKIAGAADELLMNAIFDAPTNDEGNSLYGEDAHGKDIPLDGKRAVEMQVGFDGKYAAVLVTDQFGSLDPPRLLEKLAKNYTEAEYVPSGGLARAGLGIFTVFHSGGSLFFVVRKSARTDALVFFRNTETFREFREQFRFFTLRSGRK
jgi:anti-sigma regulatory factor (Ser/Thr protein kinase)